MMAVSSPLDEVAQKLTQDQNAVRIKKLVFYACYERWENDAAKLNNLSLKNLISDLVQHHTTLEELTTHLNKRVQTLSKPAEYTLISNIIINCLKPLYDYPDPTQILSNKNVYADIAGQFDHDADQLRIKKLLFAVCYSRWENDVAQLDAVGFEQLIRQLYELVATREQLKAVLESIVATLNRKSEYTLVSHKILEAVLPLYTDTVEHTQPLTMPNVLVQQQAPVLPPSPPGSTTPSSDSQESSPAKPTQEEVDFFDVRMEIMKYTSPLRAKLLIFSALHRPLPLNRQTLSIMRSHHLDELVEKLFRSYRTPVELESKLKEVADRLAEPDQYAQAAGAILRAGRLVYGRSLLPPIDSDINRPPLQSATALSFSFPSAPGVGAEPHVTSDDTCAFFSSPAPSSQPPPEGIEDDSDDEDSTQVL
jgi:hypothetical protein